MNRRSFLGTIAALPLAPFAIPKAAAAVRGRRRQIEWGTRLLQGNLIPVYEFCHPAETIVPARITTESIARAIADDALAARIGTLQAT